MILDSKLINKISSFSYVSIFLIFVFRYFILNISLGYGLGDLVYIVLFSIWSLITILITLLNNNKKVLITTSIFNCLMIIYILLMMYVFIGIEAINR
jgi:hypothetical protein